MLVSINDSIGFCQLHCQRNENLTPKQPLDVYNPHPSSCSTCTMDIAHCACTMCPCPKRMAPKYPQIG